MSNLLIQLKRNKANLTLKVITKVADFENEKTSKVVLTFGVQHKTGPF